MTPSIKQGAIAFLCVTPFRSANHSKAPHFLPNRMSHSLGDRMPDALRIRAGPVHQEDSIIRRDDGALSEDAVNIPVFERDLGNAELLASKSSKFSTYHLFRERVPPLSVLLLNLLAVIWGCQHALIKMVVSDPTVETSAFTLLRFSLAAVLASPYLPGPPSFFNQEPSEAAKNEKLKATWKWGLEMGFWMFLGFSLQAIGLESTTAQRSGFLLYLNVKFVPFLAWLLLRREISIPTWISAFSAFLGTALLALDGQTIGWNVGDAWSIAAAASSAMFILRLEAASSKVPDSAELNSACLLVVAFFSAVWTVLQTGLSTEKISSTFLAHPVELLFLGGVTTALANYIQTKAQKDISAERASVIYSLDPVYGAFFSWLLLGETLGGFQSFVGAGLITIAAATNAFLDLGTGRKSKS